jgi:guanylate kinase
MSNESTKGKCVIFSAPSGAGKTTIVHHLLEKFPELEFSVSACSRPRRANETDGVDYYFLSVEEFKKRINENAFFEWEEVYTDNFYGTLRSEIERIWNKGKHVIFDVDVVGGMNLKNIFGDRALAVFVKAPSLAHLEAATEMAYAEKFDHVLLNDDLHRAFEEAEITVSKFLNT